MLRVTALSLADTHGVAARVASVSRPGDVIVLAGQMGAGKTAFAQGFGLALGVTEPITSPTFTLVHSYDSGRMPMHHADIYRLSSLHEVADLALSELGGVVIVEWGDVVAGTFGDHLLVHLQHVDEPVSDDEFDSPSRHITLTGHGKSWAIRWAALTDTIGEMRC